MRPNLDGAGSGPSAYLHQKIKTENQIPRTLVNIPADQKALLDRSDSWAEHLQDGPNTKVNIPAHVLEQVKYSHISKILPPCGQRPPSSSTSEPKNSGNKDASSGLGSPEPDENATQISWSPSPQPEDQREPFLPDDSPLVNRTDRERFPSQEIDSLPPVIQPPSTAISSGSKPSTSSGSLPPVYLTQAPQSSIPQDVLLSSPEKTSSQAPTPHAPRGRQHTNTTRQMAAVVFPPSSAGTEDELPMVIPGAVDTPPITKVASRPRGFQELNSTPSNGTPPCGQAIVIPGTLSPATPPISRALHHLRGTQDSISDAPRYGQGNNIIESTYPDVRMGDADAPSSHESRNMARTPGRHGNRHPKQAPGGPPQKMMRIRFEPSSEDNVQVRNTPTKNLPVKGPESPQDKAISSPTLRIESTFPADHVAMNGETKEVDVASTATPKASTLVDPAPEEPVAQKTSEAPAIEAIIQPTVPVRQVVDPGPFARPTTAAMPEPDLAQLFWTRPYEAFETAYPDFNGSLGDFVRACLSIRTLRRKRMLPIFLYDDFIRIFCGEYIRYVEGTDDDPPQFAMEWYVEHVRAPVFEKRLVSDQNLGRVFKIHKSEFDSACTDLGGMSLNGDSFSVAAQTDSRVASEPRSVTSGPVTTTSALQLNVTPPPISRKRRASMMSSVENVPPEFRIEGQQYAQASPDLAHKTGGKKQQTTSAESPREVAEPVRAGKSASGSVSAARGVHPTTPNHQPGDLHDPSASEQTKGAKKRFFADPLPDEAEAVDLSVSASGSRSGRPTMSDRQPTGSRRLVAAGSPILSSMDVDWRAEFLRLKEDGAFRPQGEPGPETPAPLKAKANAAMRPPQVRSAASDMTANDRIQARRRTLPGTWKASQTSRQNPRPGAEPSSPAASVLTQASGVKKRKKKLPSTEEYKNRLERLRSEGRLPGGASSSAP